MPTTPFSVSEKELAKLQKNAGKEAVELPRSESTIVKVTQTRRSGHTDTRKAKSKAQGPLWTKGFYRQFNHWYRRVDEHRFITRCMRETSRPGWQPQEQPGAPECPDCAEVIEKEQP